MTITEHQHLCPHPKLLPLTIDSGNGCYVFDTLGRRYLDFVTGIGVTALGHNHPRISAAIAEQAHLCLHTSNLYSHPYQAPLARELCRLSRLDRAVFTNSGTEATEAALKLARCWGQAHHESKTGIVALTGSFHGRTRAALAVTGQPSLNQPFAPYATPVTFVAPGDCAALRDAVGSRTAALILEPIQGEGGVRPLSREFLHCARDATRRHNALLIADEVQCGLGRTGEWFVSLAQGVQPDIVTLAKPLAAGLPLGAVVFSQAVHEKFPAGSHATTFGGGPLACRVALEFLNLTSGLLPHIRDTAELIRRRLDDMRHRRAVIRDVRAAGLMIGIELQVPATPYVEGALNRGLLINCTQQNVLRLLPPFILTRDQADQGLDILDRLFAS